MLTMIRMIVPFLRATAVSMLLGLLLTACATARVDPTTAVTPTATPTSSATPSATAVSTANNEPTISVTTTSPTATPFASPNIQYLAAAVEQTLADFDGVSSYIIKDLNTGDTISHNADVAIAGMSLVKIPILIETYRALDNPPGIEATKLLTQTTALSSNFAANLLLKTVVGPNDTYAGADILTASMRQLGAFNTFITVPYDLEPRPDQINSYLTLANQRTDVTTLADPFRQTTMGDLALLLEMIYTCAETGNGRLTDTYPATITQTECQEILLLMQQNELVALLEAGLPAETTFAHKIGYIDDTYGDIGIVYSPNGDYLVALALYTPNWLEWAIAEPLFTEIARQSYAHFNDPDAYTADILAQPPTLEATAVPQPTPAYPQAIVFGTQGIGLTLRDTPGGNELAILPEGSVVSLLDTEATEWNTVFWRQIATSDGQTGWVGVDFLLTDGR